MQRFLSLLVAVGAALAVATPVAAVKPIVIQARSKGS
jgi:hypothetical protein